MNMEVLVHEGVMTRAVGNEIVLLDLEAGIYYGLDAVGARAWQLWAGKHGFDDVLTIMCEEYDVERSTLASDLTELLRRLEQARLVTVTPSPSA
jgi:hypothetical protein